MVRAAETYLWPNALAPDAKREIAQSEVVQVYPHRHSIPQEQWTHLIDQACLNISILVYAGLFLTDNPNLIQGRPQDSTNPWRPGQP